MSEWKCRYIPPVQWKTMDNERRVNKIAASAYWQPGDIWSASWLYDPNDLEDHAMLSQNLAQAIEGKKYLSAHYYRDWGNKRSPLMVMLPNGLVWCVDSCNRREGGWRVTGEAPALTCDPSISTPSWHGWLRDGVLSET